MDLPEQCLDIDSRAVAEEVPDGSSDLGGGKNHRSDLIEQWLKGVVADAFDKRDRDIRMMKLKN